MQNIKSKSNSFKKWGMISVFCLIVSSQAFAIAPTIGLYENDEKKTIVIKKKKIRKKKEVKNTKSFRTFHIRNINRLFVDTINTSTDNSNKNINDEVEEYLLPHSHMNFASLFPGRKIRLSNYVPIMYDNNGQERRSTKDWPPLTP